MSTVGTGCGMVAKSMSGAPWTALLLLAACDESVVLGQAPDLSRLVSVEVVATAQGACDAAPEPTVRFAIVDQDRRSLGPGMELATHTQHLVLTAGGTFGASDLSVVDNRSVLYPTPAVLCATDDDCALAGFDGASCRVLLEGRSECGFDAALSVDAGVPLVWTGPDIAADTLPPIDTLVLVPHGSLQVGVLPSGQVDPTFSTDPARDLVAAASLLVRRLATDIREGPDRMAIGVYPGDDGAPFVVDAGGLSWFDAESLSGLSEAQSELFASAARPVALPADPQSALLAALSDPGWRADAGRRHVVLMVDAPEAQETRFDVDLIERALAEAGAALHVVQLDHEVACPTSGRHAVGPCTPCEVSECEPPLLVARSGISAELSELACVSGGSFSYADSPEELVAFATPIARAVAGHWIAALSLEPDVDVPAGTYAASFELEVALLDEVATQRFELEHRGLVADARQLVWIGAPSTPR